MSGFKNYEKVKWGQMKVKNAFNANRRGLQRGPFCLNKPLKIVYNTLVVVAAIKTGRPKTGGKCTMFRTLIWFIYFWLYQLGAYPKLRKADWYMAQEKIAERDAMVSPEIEKWSLSLLKLAGCEVEVIGRENLIASQPVLYVSNHQGNFDIPILLGHLPGMKGFVAKDSIEKMPLVNRWMKHIHCVFMNRENLRQSAAAINEGIRNIKAGYSMVIFPEGTRSKDGNLLEFKPGAFKLGTKPAAPIVPVTISGSIHMMPKGSIAIRPSKVKVTIHPAIMPETYAGQDTVDLSEQVKAIITTAL